MKRCQMEQALLILMKMTGFLSKDELLAELIWS